MRKILIVDDEKRIRDLQASLLRSVGFKVVDAGDAREATDILVRKAINLVLLDLNMPDVDGRELFGIIEEHDPRIKVIVSSVFSTEKQRQMIPNAADYYDKAQGPFVLLSKINNVLALSDEAPALD